MIGGGLVTLEKIKVIHYRHHNRIKPEFNRLTYILGSADVLLVSTGIL